MSYVLPQVQVFQLFRQLPQNVIKNLNAFVFGEHYQLFRYSEPAEKELVGLGAYDPDTDTSYAWPSLPAGATVDQDYTKLYVDNLWAEFFSVPASATHEAQIISESERNKVRVESTVFRTANGVTRSGTVPRDVRIGDRVRYEYTDYSDNLFEGTTKVVGFEADMSAAVVGVAAPKASNPGTQTGTADLDTGNTTVFAAASGNTAPMSGSAVIAAPHSGPVHTMLPMLSTGLLGDTITVTVTTGGPAGAARARVSYASGLYLRNQTPIEDIGVDEGRVYLGNALYLYFVAEGLESTEFAVGDVYTVTVEAPFSVVGTASGGTYTGQTDTVYKVEVVRGGAVLRYCGTAHSATNDFSAVVDAYLTDRLIDWTGGDVDVEYVLRCTNTDAAIENCVFSLWSTAGDNATISPDATGKLVVGTFGLVLELGTTHQPDLHQTVIVRAYQSRPRLKVTDTKGVDTTTYINVTNGVPYVIGTLGVTLTVANNNNYPDQLSGSTTPGGLLVGATFYIACTASAPGAVKTLVLADTLNASIAAGANIGLTLYSVQNSKLITAQRTQSSGDWNWVGDASEITVNSGLAVQDPSIVGYGGAPVWLPVYKGDMYVEYRALRDDYTDTIRAIESVSDVETVLGTVHPDNPLAQGVYNALLNSGDRAVYFMAVPQDNLAGWSHVLDRAALSSDVYAFAPLSQSSSVLDLVQAHVQASSTETEKHWRIAFVGTEMPTEESVYTQVTHPTGGDYYATVTLDAVTGANTLLTFVNADGTPDTTVTALDHLRRGDKIRIGFETDPWGAPSYTEYEVATVLSENTLRLTSGPATEIDTATVVEAIHPYTTQESAEAIASRSTGFYSRRMYHIFPSRAVGGGVVQDSPFVAAAVAGLASSVPPQQPLTNIELVGFEDMPLVYRTFSRTQLNLMAGAGTMIAMQDSARGRVYIRHQLSTATSGGNLNESELSITKNLDSISYYFAARFSPYIGRYNITPELLLTLENVLLDGLAYLASLTDVGLLGPQLIAEETELVGLNQHPTLRDHVEAVVNLGMPKPFNVLQLRLVV